MKKVVILITGFILIFGISSCSVSDETTITTITPQTATIPSQFQGTWKIKYQDSIDISDSGSFLLFTANKATIEIKKNNGAFSRSSTASYQVGTPEKIFMFPNTTLEINSSTIYPGFTQFVVRL